MTSISPLWLTSFDWWKAVFFFIADRNLGLSSSVRWTDPADWLGLLTNQTKEKSQNQNGRKEKKGPTLFRFFLHWRQCDCDVIAHLLTSRSVAELVAVRKKKRKTFRKKGPRVYPLDFGPFINDGATRKQRNAIRFPMTSRQSAGERENLIEIPYTVNQRRQA